MKAGQEGQLGGRGARGAWFTKYSGLALASEQGLRGRWGHCVSPGLHQVMAITGSGRGPGLREGPGRVAPACDEASVATSGLDAGCSQDSILTDTGGPRLDPPQGAEEDPAQEDSSKKGARAWEGAGRAGLSGGHFQGAESHHGGMLVFAQDFRGREVLCPESSPQN